MKIMDLEMLLREEEEIKNFLFSLNKKIDKKNLSFKKIFFPFFIIVQIFSKHKTKNSKIIVFWKFSYFFKFKKVL